MPDLVAEALSILRETKTNANDALSALDRLAADVESPVDTAIVLADVRTKLAAAQDLHIRVAELLIRIARLQKGVNTMCLEGAVYWLYPAGRDRQGPFCPQCWEGANKATSLKNVPFRGHDRWVCRVCAKTFFSEGAQAAMNASERSAAHQQRGPSAGLPVDE